MQPGTYRLDIVQGADFDETWTWKDSDGVAINLTGYTARLQVRATKAAADKLVDITHATDVNTVGKITLGGAAGTIRVQLPAVATAAYQWETGEWDIELIDSSSVVTRLLEGRAKNSKEVTR